jgi:hypothetical protein
VGQLGSGDVVGRCRIDEAIGRGGMGVVYRRASSSWGVTSR